VKRISYPDLVKRLYDLTRLATPPDPGERAGCFSSYERRSRYNEESGLYEDWDANADGSGYIRNEGENIVAFEQTGPGVIWRVWSAFPEAGHIQIFIDENPAPVIDMPFRDFFERHPTSWNPLGVMNVPELTPTLSRGRNHFIPIPYQRSCKVLLAPDWGGYYHFTYSAFPEETRLPEFTLELDREAWIALAKADRILAQRGWNMPLEHNSHIEEISAKVPAGETVTVGVIEGNRAITGLRVLVDGLDRTDDKRVLRELCLSIKWDGETSPSVWSPLGDFFGTAPGVNYFRSLPVGMTTGFFYSHWYMPFAHGAVIELHNDGAEDQVVNFKIAHHPLKQDANELLRFHAKWHQDALLEQSQHSGRDIDWPFLHAKGRGRFCGVHLHVWNRWETPDQPAESWWYGAWDRKSIDWWWGEGDEKFFVDGEKFPSTFGTGSEDYFGYAWAAEPPFPRFESAFACQPAVELDANGHTSVNRFHICDEIPFQVSFEGCIEKYKANQWGEGNACLYDVVAYWYQEAGQVDPYDVLPHSEKSGLFSLNQSSDLA